MKIRISDTNNGKFTQQLMDHWEEQGHDVKRSMYYEHEFAEEADMYFFDCADMTTEHFCKAKRKRPKKVIIRSLDIDVWHRYYNNIDFDWVDDWIFINDHLRNKVFDDWKFPKPKNTKVHTIHCGVDTNDFSLRKDTSRGTRVAFVGRLWIGKGVADAVKIVRDLNYRKPGHSLHILGQNADPHWWDNYLDYLMEEQDFEITIYEHVPDVSAWLEDKTYLVMTSPKEAFSYAVAEAMSKGIKPAINNFWSVDKLWPEEYVYTTHREATDILLGNYEPHKYRDYILDNYDENYMFNKIDKLFQ